MTHTLLALTAFGGRPDADPMPIVATVVFAVVLIIALIAVYVERVRKDAPRCDPGKFQFNEDATPRRGSRKLAPEKVTAYREWYFKNRPKLADHFNKRDAHRAYVWNVLFGWLFTLVAVAVVIGASSIVTAICAANDAERAAWDTEVAEWAEDTYGVTASVEEFVVALRPEDGFIDILIDSIKDNSGAPRDMAGVVIVENLDGRTAIDATLTWVSGTPVLRERNTPNAGIELERVTR